MTAVLDIINRKEPPAPLALGQHFRNRDYLDDVYVLAIVGTDGGFDPERISLPRIHMALIDVQRGVRWSDYVRTASSTCITTEEALAIFGSNPEVWERVEIGVSVECRGE